MLAHHIHLDEPAIPTVYSFFPPFFFLMLEAQIGSVTESDKKVNGLKLVDFIFLEI